MGLLQHGLSYVPFVALWPWKTLNTGAKRLRKGGGEVGVLACRPREGPTAADVTLPTRYLPRAGWSVPVPRAVAVPYMPSPFPVRRFRGAAGLSPFAPRAPVSTEELSQ
jgi:hypothetical protein